MVALGVTDRSVGRDSVITLATTAATTTGAGVIGVVGFLQATLALPVFARDPVDVLDAGGLGEIRGSGVVTAPDGQVLGYGLAGQDQSSRQIH